MARGLCVDCGASVRPRESESGPARPVCFRGAEGAETGSLRLEGCISLAAFALRSISAHADVGCQRKVNWVARKTYDLVCDELARRHIALSNAVCATGKQGGCEQRA